MTCRRHGREEETMKAWHAISILLLSVPVLTVCSSGPSAVEAREQSDASASPAARLQTIPVSGSAVHYFTTAIIHGQEPTATGMIQRSSEIIRLTGDLDGFILYHPISTFDFESGTLVNTGNQLFSGTIAGSAPVILHDDRFRFEIDLNSGATAGQVHLSRSDDAPHKGGWYECDLAVVGTGLTPEGDGMADYTGECTGRGSLN
jgi:hypothetical protein